MPHCDNIDIPEQLRTSAIAYAIRNIGPYRLRRIAIPSYQEIPSTVGMNANPMANGVTTRRISYGDCTERETPVRTGYLAVEITRAWQRPFGIFETTQVVIDTIYGSIPAFQTTQSAKDFIIVTFAPYLEYMRVFFQGLAGKYGISVQGLNNLQQGVYHLGPQPHSVPDMLGSRTVSKI